MAIVDGRTLPDGRVDDYDLCVVGSGPAGLAIAREFIDSGLKVVVLESGGLDFDDDTQALAAGAVVGVPYSDLTAARLRMFGGTSNHWGGNMRPLDALDFEQRDWIPDSGWPFGLEHLRPWYRRALSFFFVPEDLFDVERDHHGADKAGPLESDGLQSQVFATVGGPGLSLGTGRREDFARAGSVDVHLYSNVTHIDTDASASEVTGLEVRTLTGLRSTYRAKAFVLATGGIENARLLLASDRTNPAGLGNDHDLVGRYFMEHLTNPEFADFLPADPRIDLAFYDEVAHRWGQTWGVFRLSDSLQRDGRIPNMRFQFATIWNAFNTLLSEPGLSSLQSALNGQGDIGRHVANMIADIESVAEASAYRLLFPDGDFPLRAVEVVHIGEQVPNRDSRVVLGDEVDALGMRRAVLDWRLTPIDNAGALGSAALLARQLGQAGLGRLADSLPQDVFDAAPPQPHMHHMGTTRMHADATRGVVDANSRVHGLTNLFVAGSSVFPTGGNVNPTLTLVALALRLADHLKEQVLA